MPGKWSGKSKRALWYGGAALLFLVVTLILIRVRSPRQVVTEEPEDSFEETVDSWSEKVTTWLWVVDPDHPLPSSYEPDGLTEVENSHIQLNKDAAAAFAAMVGDMPNPVFAANGYISAAAQQNLYESRMQQFLDDGYTEERAKLAIQEEYYPGGADEHQLGLTVDVCADSSLTLDSDFRSTEQGQWLAENAWRYGFVYRAKAGTRGVYKPWSLRYVGDVHAQVMYDLNLTLEEYLQYLQDKSTTSVTIGSTGIGMTIFYQDTLDNIPLKIKEVSGDNNGHYIITCYR